MSLSTITAIELHSKIAAGQPVEVIDVRTPVEFREVHLSFAKNIPLDRLTPSELAAKRNGSAANPLYVICRSGKRGHQACEKLIAAGMRNVVNIEGGTAAWEQAGLPVIRGQKAMSLERQVRIAAGSLVVIGALLSFIHPYWIGLSAFVGAGLVFAGLTDTCGMGMMLARMPWNQVTKSCPETSDDSAACSSDSSSSCRG